MTDMIQIVPKGGQVALTGKNMAREVLAVLDWNKNEGQLTFATGEPVSLDLDVAAVFRNGNGQTIVDPVNGPMIAFYDNAEGNIRGKINPFASFAHLISGDNRDGEGDEDEKLRFVPGSVPQNAEIVDFFICIYPSVHEKTGEQVQPTFIYVDGGRCRFYDGTNDRALFDVDLSLVASLADETGFHFVRGTRAGSVWTFTNISEHNPQSIYASLPTFVNTVLPVQ